MSNKAGKFLTLTAGAAPSKTKMPAQRMQYCMSDCLEEACLMPDRRCFSNGNVFSQTARHIPSEVVGSASATGD